MELYRDVACALDFEDARRHVSVVGELGVGVVIHQQDIEFLAAPNHFFEILLRSNGGGRIVRIVQVKNLCLLEHVARNPVQVDQKSIFRSQCVLVGCRFGQQCSAYV